MSDGVSVSADLGNLPSNSLAVLGSIQPILKALSADNVNPLAVLQMEAIGVCFQINGPFAAKVPDALTRSSSIRLERLSQWVGWMQGDTASAMSQTAGGRAASLLSLCLTEIYGEQSAGLLLHELSSEILPASSNHASMMQLGQVAATLSKKLAMIGYGSHMAVHVTRIRAAFFDSDRDPPRDLLQDIAVEEMVHFLHYLHRALHEENTILRCRGTAGAGHIATILLALCPDDIVITVEDELIFQGKRRNVLVGIAKGQTHLTFTAETIIRGQSSALNSRSISEQSFTRKNPLWWPLHMAWTGCLADILDLALVYADILPSEELRLSVANLVATIPFSFSGSQLDVNDDSAFRSLRELPLPLKGFLSLLGPNAMTRIRETLTLIFRERPSFASFDVTVAYSTLRALVKGLYPDPERSPCACHTCGDKFVWAKVKITQCPLAQLWATIGDVVERGVASLFFTGGRHACVPYANGNTLCFSGKLLRAIERRAHRVIPDEADLLLGGASLHQGMLRLVTARNFDRVPLGESSGSISIFPSTIQEPSLRDPPCIEYVLADGQFHDGLNYYQSLVTEDIADRRRWGEAEIAKSLVPRDLPIRPSSLGTHSLLVMTARKAVNGLVIRTEIEYSTKVVEIDFLAVHIAHISVLMDSNCGHSRRAELSNVDNVIATSVLFPGPPGEYTPRTLWSKWDKSTTSITLTSGNPESQFLCCLRGVPTIFQGNSCLDCVMREAKKQKVRHIIQS